VGEYKIFAEQEDSRTGYGVEPERWSGRELLSDISIKTKARVWGVSSRKEGFRTSPVPADWGHKTPRLGSAGAGRGKCALTSALGRGGGGSVVSFGGRRNWGGTVPERAKEKMSRTFYL